MIPKIISILFIGIFFVACREADPRYTLDCSDSSAISEASYNPETQVLRVRFVGGDVTYTHGDFPETTWNKWQKAPSKGKFYSKYIRSQQSGKE